MSVNIHCESVSVDISIGTSIAVETSDSSFSHGIASIK